MLYILRDHALFSNEMVNDEARTSTIIGTLPDAISCEVERNTEAMFSLSLSYPRSGENAEELILGNAILSPVGGTLGDQIFLISSVEEDESGVITVLADHISYNSQYILAAPFEVRNTYSENLSFMMWKRALMDSISKVSRTQMHDFVVVGKSDIMKLNVPRYERPVSLRQAVKDAIEGRNFIILADGFSLKIWKVDTDEDPSFMIMYGKNMVSYRNSADMEDFFTQIYPYVMVELESGEGKQFVDYTGPGTTGGSVFRVRDLPVFYAGTERTVPMDFSDYGGIVDSGWDISNLKWAAEQWINDHPYVPQLPPSISVAAIPDDGNTYELGLIGDVIYTPAGDKIRTEITSLKYDVLADRVTEIGVGAIKKGIIDAVASSVSTMDNSERRRR